MALGAIIYMNKGGGPNDSLGSGTLAKTMFFLKSGPLL